MIYVTISFEIIANLTYNSALSSNSLQFGIFEND